MNLVFPILLTALLDAMATERARMVEFQLRARDIVTPRVLEVMAATPREAFVPADHQKDAYADEPLPIGWGQTISQPYIVALMTQLLDPKPHERILEIGTGSGYQAAILSPLAREVYTIEIVQPLADRARQTLDTLGYQNVFVRAGDGYAGWPEQAPFDAVIVTCAPDHIPTPLVNQVKEGGRMIIPVGERFGVQKLLRLTKKEGIMHQEEVLDVRFVPLTRDPEGR